MSEPISTNRGGLAVTSERNVPVARSAPPGPARADGRAFGALLAARMIGRGPLATTPGALGPIGLGPMTPGATALEPLIASAAERVGLDPALIAAVVRAESGFDPRAVSPAGAKGLMQLMDGTARRLGVSDPFDPAQNLNAGARYLRQLLDRYRGELPLALAAYNAGSGAVDHYQGIPPYAETRGYVAKVLGLYRQAK